MATQTLKNKVAAAKKLFKKAQEVAKSGGLGNSNVEDGRYHAQITSARGPVEAQSGRLQAVLAFEIKEGECQGEKLTSFPNLENEIGLGILIRELQGLGYSIDDFDDIEGVLAEINKEKPEVRISVKTKGEFQNISIDKALDASAGDGSGDADPAPEGDDPTPEAPAEDPTPEEDPAPESGSVELEVGSAIVFTLKGVETNGEIIEVVDEETVRIKAEDGKTYKLGTDKIQPAAPAPKKVQKVKPAVKKR